MSPAKILLVEDDRFIREVYSDIISNAGYFLDTAIDGEEGYSKIKQGGWDLILLDIILPKMTGFEIMQKLTASPPTPPNKSLVFLTNVDDSDDKQKATSIGQGYIIKSQITPDDLLIVIKKYLSIIS